VSDLTSGLGRAEKEIRDMNNKMHENTTRKTKKTQKRI